MKAIDSHQLLAKLSSLSPQIVKDCIPAIVRERILRALVPTSERVEPDTYLISYHKSGRTWLRVLIGKALAERWGYGDEDVLRAPGLAREHGVDTLAWTHDGSAALDERRYWELNADKSRFRDKKVIFLTRDIRDLIVSSYYAMKKRDRQFEGSLSDFVRSDIFGVRRILTFYKHWQDSQDIPAAFLHISYEEMHAAPAATLVKVLDFINAADVDRSIIETSVEFARFENMRHMEETDFFGSGVLRPKDPSDPESFKVRKGRVGGYTSELSDADLAYIDRAVAEMGSPFI